MPHDQISPVVFGNHNFSRLAMEPGVDSMKEKLLGAGLILAMLLAVPGLAWAQAVQQNWTLIVSGQPGRAPALRINGRSYVDIEALARLTNGSLAFKGNQITLTLPALVASPPAAASPASHSRNFLTSFCRQALRLCP